MDVKKMTDIELADFEAGHRSGTRNHILSREEWARRQGMPAGRRAWIAIWISVSAMVLAALSALLAYLK